MFRSFVPPKRPMACYVPTLFVKGTGLPVYDPLCEVALFALTDMDWNARWRIDEGSVLELQLYIETYSGSFGKLLIQKDQILEFVSDAANHGKVRKLPSALHGILGEELVHFTFDHFDKDGNGSLCKDEFKDFLMCLKDVHLQYLLRSSLQQYRAFFGRGYLLNDRDHENLWSQLENPADEAEEVEAEAEESSPRRSPSSPAAGYAGAVVKAKHLLHDSAKSERLSLTSLGWRPDKEEQPRTVYWGLDPDCAGYTILGFPAPFPGGFLQDLYYYSANYHPIHGILACDPMNLLDSFERFCIEVATISFSLIMLRMRHMWVVEGHAPHPWLRHERVFSTVMVTLPSMIMFQVLIALFSRLGLVNAANLSQFDLEAVQTARRRARIGEFCGYMLILFLLGYNAWVFKHCITETCHLLSFLPLVAYARGVSYLFSWALMLVLTFNPVFAWGQPDPELGICLGDYIGIGQWRIERMRFKWRCQNGAGQLDEYIQERWRQAFVVPGLCSSSKRTCVVQ